MSARHRHARFPLPVSANLLDPHALLEIAEDADESAIRRAFRRLAMRWHPDRNADPAAAERFREIRAAYEHLINPPDAGSADDPPAEAGEAARGADRHEEIWLSLAEAMLGCDKPFTLRRERECSDCGGSGRVELAHTRLCTDCHGSGRVRNASGLVACSRCEGKGYVRSGECGGCAGSGRRHADQVVTVHVAAGVLPGEVLRLRGLGHDAGNGGIPGTLFLTVRLQPHPIFELDGRDLRSVQPISALRLIAGGRASLAGPLGPVIVELAPGSGLERELRLEGKGFPGRGGDMRSAGALVIRLEGVLPQALDEDQLARIARLEGELQRDDAAHYPALAAWRRSYRDLL